MIAQWYVTVKEAGAPAGDNKLPTGGLFLVKLFQNRKDYNSSACITIHYGKRQALETSACVSIIWDGKLINVVNPWWQCLKTKPLSSIFLNYPAQQLPLKLTYSFFIVSIRHVILCVLYPFVSKRNYYHGLASCLHLALNFLVPWLNYLNTWYSLL